MYKESKWAKEILSLQSGDGSWGYFHSLSMPSQCPITTEQALRRLAVLGYTFEDEPIQKAIFYLNDCLTDKKHIPDRREKLHDWDIFSSLMISTWIRRFTKDNDMANRLAEKWATVISSAFISGEYSHDEYVKAYHEILGMKPKGGRLIDFVNFYPVSLTADMFEKKTEGKVFDYILNHKEGVYYLYNSALSVLPDTFASKKSSHYLAAIEILTAYKTNLKKLGFVCDRLMSNRNENGKWDMGGSVNDKVYFPLSDSWRRTEIREMDCTYRVQKLLDSIIDW
jgi:hypothetical protein